MIDATDIARNKPRLRFETSESRMSCEDNFAAQTQPMLIPRPAAALKKAVLIAASVLRFQPLLVAYVTLLCIAAYLFQVWKVVVDGTSNGSADVSVRFLRMVCP